MLRNAIAAAHWDTSEIAEPLDRIKEGVQHLHGELDSFASGNTQSLSGQAKRDSVYHLLYDIDVELRVIDRLRAKDWPLLRSHVTTAMKKDILWLKRTIEQLRRPLLQEGCSIVVRSRLRRLRERIDALTQEAIYSDAPEAAEVIREVVEGLDYGHGTRLERALQRFPDQAWLWSESSSP